MIFSLNVSKNTRDSLVLRRSKPWRFVFLGIAFFLILGSILIREAPPLFIVITAICLLAGLYDDRWDFSRDRGILVYRSGIGPLCRTREYSLDSLGRVSLRSAVSSGFTSEKIGASKAPAFPDLFRRGRSTLWLEFSNGSPRFLIDEGTHRDKGSLENTGTAIASWCRIPFEGPDTDTSPADDSSG